jgi:hypothetical protein
MDNSSPMFFDDLHIKTINYYGTVRPKVMPKSSGHKIKFKWGDRD